MPSSHVDTCSSDFSWFDLSKYEGMYHFEALSWLRHLSLRSVIYEYIWQATDDVEATLAQLHVSIDRSTTVLDVANWLLSTPIPSSSDLPVSHGDYPSRLTEHGKWLFYSWFESRPYAKPIVELADLRTVAHAVAQMDEDDRRRFIELVSFYSAERMNYFQPTKESEWASDTYLPSDSGCLKVRWGESKSSTLQAIERILDRHEPAKTEWSAKPLRANRFALWNDIRLLPYMDLVIWSELKGTRFTQAEAAELLFPDDPNAKRSADNIRKATEKRAYEIFDGGPETGHLLSLLAREAFPEMVVDV